MWSINSEPLAEVCIADAGKQPGRPVWALMDCNNFYASCERLFRPDLEGRPVVVLSNNDGCIVARSAEAKALGIPMGEPEYKARPLLRRHKVAVFSSNYALYGDISSRVMGIAETVAPQVHVYSIDEAFMRLDGALGPQADAVARALVERVRRWVGIAVSVGLAPTRTLAKLANYMAKKEGVGVFAFPEEPAERDILLRRIPVEAVWGIGRRQAARLQGRGVTTAAGLRDLNDGWLRDKLTVTGWRTAMELRGIPCIDENQLPTPRRTLVSSRSFAEKVTEMAHLSEALTCFTTRAAERLRAEDLLTGGICVHIRTSRHGQGEYFEQTVHVSLPEPTADTVILIKAAERGLASAFKAGVAYAKAGVMLVDLCPRKGRQGNLLALGNEEARQRRERLMAALDAVNGRFGRHTLHTAAEGMPLAAGNSNAPNARKPSDAPHSPEKQSSPDAPHSPWHMKREFRSPSVTTDWNELAVAKCK